MGRHPAKLICHLGQKRGLMFLFRHNKGHLVKGSHCREGEDDLRCPLDLSSGERRAADLDIFKPWVRGVDTRCGGREKVALGGAIFGGFVVLVVSCCCVSAHCVHGVLKLGAEVWC